VHTYQTVIVEKTPDKVATITLNRPERMNSFNLAMLDDFKAFWTDVREDLNVNAIVIRASEGRAFCTGVDVKESKGVVRSDNNVWLEESPFHSLGAKANRCWKPVISAVHGLAAGGAFYMLNESDITICSDDAEFFDPHTTYGMVAALEPIGAVYKMPLGEIMRMVLMGLDERISAATALRIGLVSEVVAKDALWSRAHELAAKIAAKPPAAIQGSVRAVWESLEVPRSAAMHRGLAYPQIGNAIGESEIDRATIMAGGKAFELR
jgi:enoyl-CoA hydratase/carnithine racemase